MRFYMTPGSCSLGIHVLLTELDLCFQAHVVDLLAGEHLSSDFLAVNPRGTVPVWVDENGEAFTSFQAIAYHLAEHYPRARLLPEDLPEAERVMDVMDLVVGGIHGEGFARVFMPERYSTTEEERSRVEEEGRRLASLGFSELEKQLLGTPFVSGGFSIADAAAFYVELWAERTNMPLPTGCQTHFESMLKRPAVRQVLAEEGYISTLQKYPA